MATIERYFYPDYLTMDFPTVLNKFKTVLQNTTEFADINYEGSNVRIYAEMLAYLAELNTYYLNRIAKNIYPDTVELYENAHRISQQIGYSPKGYISASGEIRVILKQSTAGEYWSENDVLYLPLWSSFSTNSSINFLSAKTIQTTVSSSNMVNPETGASDPLYFIVDIPVKQGTKSPTYSYTGADLIDYKIYLPNMTYDHDADITDEYQSIFLTVNGVTWKRVDTFFDPVILNDSDSNVYRFTYDKFQRYVIEFSPFRNYPKNTTDKISVELVVSKGTGGNVGARTIVGEEGIIFYNMKRSDPNDSNKQLPLGTSRIDSIYNLKPTTGGKNPESLDEIKTNSKSFIYSQARSVTADDYEFWLKQRSDVVAARSWGERDINPDPTGNYTHLYNKIFVTCIPKYFGTTTLLTEELAIPESIRKTTDTISVVSDHNQEWVAEILKYLQGRKMLSTSEIFSLPILVYFMFDIGIKAKRIYSYDSIVSAVKAKLKYYFEPSNRKFFENISFMDIFNFIMDPTIINGDETFSAVQGIDNLIFRNIDIIYATSTDKIHLEYSKIAYEVKNTVYEYNNTEHLYPQYDKKLSSYYPTIAENSIENKMTGIQLGPDQFPMLALNFTNFTNEGV